MNNIYSLNRAVKDNAIEGGLSLTYGNEFSIFDNPKPVVAFPWGSKSITKIFFPFLDKPAARLITVVVFPTPPF